MTQLHEQRLLELVGAHETALASERSVVEDLRTQLSLSNGHTDSEIRLLTKQHENKLSLRMQQVYIVSFMFVLLQMSTRV